MLLSVTLLLTVYLIPGVQLSSIIGIFFIPYSPEKAHYNPLLLIDNKIGPAPSGIDFFPKKSLYVAPEEED
jgi:hypothetical protein